MKGRCLAALINNAGVAWPAPLLYQPLADFRKTLDANLSGTFIVTKVRLLPGSYRPWHERCNLKHLAISNIDMK